MISTKVKGITIGIVLVVLLISSGFRLFDDNVGVVSPSIQGIKELEGRVMGGVTSRMPENSAKILFESILGIKLSGYHSYDNMTQTLSALRANKVQAIWCPDVTAEYLTKTETGLRRINEASEQEPRLEFAMALDKENTTLLSELNGAITILQENGTLSQLILKYVEAEEDPVAFGEEDMMDGEADGENGTLYVGITGAVPPIDMVDSMQRPVGFSVALLDEIGQLLSKRIKFVYLQNDTSFSMLMGGKVDVLFCYGTSKDTRVESKSYQMTQGYLEMAKYAYLVLE